MGLPMSLHSWMSVRAAQKTAGRELRRPDRQEHIVLAITGILIAVLITAGLLALFAHLQ